MSEESLILDGLDGYQFEELVAKIMKRKGYLNINVQQYSGDMGKDIIMEDAKGNTILIECKHQHFVGRPIVQKLQGAMNHEQTQNPKKEVRGMIVTSGAFSQEAINYIKEIGQDVELIDGKKLKKLCDELNIVILNGKVQIITENSFENRKEKEIKEVISKNYAKTKGSQNHKLNISTNLSYSPVSYIRYNIAFDTHTSIGCVDSYKKSGKMAIDGVTGKGLGESEEDFFFTERFTIEKIKEKGKVIPFEFTENDIEEQAINELIEEHTHNTSYMGNNRRVYTKTCVPKRRDIDVKEFIPIYMPHWKTDIKISKIDYKQDFFVKGQDELFLVDDLRKCKICERKKGNYEDMSVCLECGRITCEKHRKIDYLDKKTPICKIHAKAFKLFIQKKYFSTKENLNKYKKIWTSMNFFKKLYEDKIAFGLSVAGALLLLTLIISSAS